MAAIFARHLARRISAKIIVPYILVIAVLAGGGTYALVRLVTSSFDGQVVTKLVDAGRRANGSMAGIEDDQRRALRAIALTEGVDTALQQGDAAYLNRVVPPLRANYEADAVFMLDREGRGVAAYGWASDTAAGALPPGIAAWPSVAGVLDRRSDEQGDKFTELRDLGALSALVTAGPVISTDGQLQGVVVVTTHIGRVVAHLSRDALAAVTLYDASGRPFGSALPLGEPGAEAIALNGPQFDAVLRLEPPYTAAARRSLTVGEHAYAELLGMLDVRGRPAAAIGLAVPAEGLAQAQALSREQIVALFTVTIAAVLLMGLLVARRITAPIMALVAANHRVSDGHLDVFVQPTSLDETGLLTHSFNQMVAELRERERVKDTFGKYLSREVTDYLLKHDVSLGGESRQITVLMSDIRNFTLLSEQLGPEGVVAFLNRYFSKMVACILEHNGRVDKYMGDAILASFGAPLPTPDHAGDAVRCALAMREALREFNAELAAEDIPPVRIGVGVNTGPVIIGNIGSADRLEYTIIGDTVNRTKRIEDLTKELGWDILIGETTYLDVQDIAGVGPPRMVTMRGHTGVTAVYPLLGLREDMAGQAGAA